MKPGRIWIRFILLLTVYYAILIAPWPGLEDAYARLFRAGAQFVLGSYGSAGAVRFEKTNIPTCASLFLRARPSSVRACAWL